MYTLTYVSTFALQEASDLVADAMLREIGKAARVRNVAADVTGYLVFENGFFLQTLEGEQAVVERLYQSIARDPRHHSLVILHRGAISERTYPTWGLSASVRRGGRREVATVVAYLKARATDNPATPPDEYFRDFLAPSRAIIDARSPAARNGTAPVSPTRIAICTNTAFWLMPTFNHIATRYGETPQTSKINDPEGNGMESVPLEYVDIDGYGSGATRVIGVNDGLLASLASYPMLANLNLIVLLARSREGEDYLSFIGHLLSHRWMGRSNPPTIMLIAADQSAEFIPAIQECAKLGGFSMQIRSGAPKAGEEIWDQVRAWLLSQNAPLVAQRESA